MAPVSLTIVGILGNISALGLFVSPLPTFWRIWKMGRTELYSGLPYVVTLFNCLLWLFYGTPFVVPDGLLIMTINGIGTVLELFYITLFLAFAHKTMRLKVGGLFAAVALAMLIIVVTTMTLVSKTENRQKVIGSLCVVVGAAMYASPLSIMKTVCTTKSVDFMPFTLSAASFMNGLLWTAYALISKDVFILIPNGVGTVLSLCQLCLYFCYMDKKRAPPPATQPICEDTSSCAGSDGQKSITARSDAPV